MGVYNAERETIMQNRFKSKVVWGSLVSAILAFLLATGAISTGLGATANLVVETIIGLLVALGILNNPTNPNGA